MNREDDQHRRDQQRPSGEDPASEDPSGEDPSGEDPSGEATVAPQQHGSRRCAAPRGSTAGDRSSDSARRSGGVASNLGSATSISSATSDGALFGPGALLADRYRIVGLLGRGGMGEVYRADDLILGQSVALKFLPEALAGNEEMRHRFLGEVRTARQVSHPNVCRVHDIGEVDGHTFLSMEFVDGEDLSTLLRRIGRLPEEKALEITRQLCAGLNGLHECGVLHRDLKPGNIMIDGRGRVRITDFGLAGIADQIEGAEIRAGTPAYMSPEQITGKGVDERSDIYALGLILFEIFTGKRVFEADTVAEFARLHQEEAPTTVSTIIPDVDPVVERVISRCLEKEPTSRPHSALAVAAALPGADPIAAALAAGEIPSPEMVAAAGETGRVKPFMAVICLVAVIAGILLFAFVNSRLRIYSYDSMPKPPVVLLDRAREIVTGLGYEYPEDTAHGFMRWNEVLSYIEENDDSIDRWEQLADGRLAAVRFWYRQSPRSLQAVNPRGQVDIWDPPQNWSGMARVMLDTHGRLIYLDGVPPEKVEPGARPSATGTETGTVAEPGAESGAQSPPAPRAAPPGAIFDWQLLFAAAELEPARFEEVEPEWLPLSHADRRAAWVGPLPGHEETEIRVEAAAFGDQPIFFRLIGPWTRPSRMTESEDTVGEIIVEVLVVLMVLIVFGGAVVMAVRNARLGRGDHRGTRRLTLFIFFTTLVQVALISNHTASAASEINQFFVGVSNALLLAAFFAAFYLALEPYVRKYWPEQIASWSRLLTGRFRDPLIGRDILIGGVFFLALVVLEGLWILGSRIMGLPADRPSNIAWSTLLGLRGMVTDVLGLVTNAPFNAMFFLLSLLILRIICRSQRIAIIVFALIISSFICFNADEGMKGVGAVLGVLVALTFSTVLFRYGLLPFMVGFFFDQVTDHVPITLDSSAWYSGASHFGLALILGLTAFGLYTSLAGKSHWSQDRPGR